MSETVKALSGRKQLKQLLSRIVTPEVQEQLLRTWLDIALGAPVVKDEKGEVIDPGRAPNLAALKYICDRVWGKTPAKEEDGAEDMLDRINSLRIGLGYETDITPEEWANKYVVKTEDENERPPGGVVLLPVIDVEGESEDASECT